MEELNQLMEQYRQILDAIKELESKKDELRTQILTIIKINDIEQYEDEKNKLEFTMNVRRGFDKERAIQFISNHGEDPDKFFLETTYEMLKVKSKGVIINGE